MRTYDRDSWLEFYGAVDVVAWESAFLMGQALHVLQDSFSHTFRSADLRRVYAVCNYLDAVRGGYDEARDGPRHSRVFDGCDDEEVRPLEQAAIRASTDLFNAGLVYLDTGGGSSARRLAHARAEVRLLRHAVGQPGQARLDSPANSTSWRRARCRFGLAIWVGQERRRRWQDLPWAARLEVATYL